VQCVEQGGVPPAAGTVARGGALPDDDVVILTGADPAFCAGVDLKELGSQSGGEVLGRADDPASGRPRRPMPPMTKPVIGAINGAAITTSSRTTT